MQRHRRRHRHILLVFLSVLIIPRQKALRRHRSSNRSHNRRPSNRRSSSHRLRRRPLLQRQRDRDQAHRYTLQDVRLFLNCMKKQ